MNEYQITFRIDEILNELSSKSSYHKALVSQATKDINICSMAMKTHRFL